MAQGGNVFEWEETEYDRVNDTVWDTRVVRGGDWDSSWDDLSASKRANISPPHEGYGKGFRVASVPEPSSLTHAILGLTGALLMRGRRPLRTSHES